MYLIEQFRDLLYFINYYKSSIWLAFKHFTQQRRPLFQTKQQICIQQIVINGIRKLLHQQCCLSCLTRTKQKNTLILKYLQLSFNHIVPIITTTKIGNIQTLLRIFDEIPQFYCGFSMKFRNTTADFNKITQERVLNAKSIHTLVRQYIRKQKKQRIILELEHHA